ncbi:MAG: DUF4296 domain-containing protein [Chitinophagales bacterium]|nr:DUF4296 domain-containing protein [Chitinophagales bacterium]MBP9703181.1 DUF4296 domain-containing protein [Chitinophagales bacterium]
MQCKPKSDLVFNKGMLNDVPDTIIQIGPMVKILADIHLAEATMQELKTDSMREHKNEIIASDYLKIMAMHHVEYEQFKSSYDYYSEHPLIMNYIYKEVTQRLSLLESKKQIE